MNHNFTSNTIMIQRKRWLLSLTWAWPKCLWYKFGPCSMLSLSTNFCVGLQLTTYPSIPVRMIWTLTKCFRTCWFATLTWQRISMPTLTTHNWISLWFPLTVLVILWDMSWGSLYSLKKDWMMTLHIGHARSWYVVVSSRLSICYWIVNFHVIREATFIGSGNSTKSTKRWRLPLLLKLPFIQRERVF